MMKLEGGFIQNLGRVYGIYTLGFLGFVILMAILEQAGVPARYIGYMFVGFTIAIYALIGVLSRTMQSNEYYVAGRQVPAVFNGMATAADWMSGASFIAMAGGIYLRGYPYMAFLVGWTGGYVLVASLLAPYLRKFGCYTVPDFIGTRYGGNLARLCAVIILVVASFTYVTAQITGTGIVASRALDIPFEVGVWFGLAGILVCSAWRYEGRYLDPGGPVHRSDNRLPASGLLDVKQAGLRSYPAVRAVRRRSPCAGTRSPPSGWRTEADG